MIRNSFYAAAALLSTMCAVTTALAAMYAGTGAGIALTSPRRRPHRRGNRRTEPD